MRYGALYNLVFGWGLRGFSKKQDEGQFYCPVCEGYQTYSLFSVKRWFSMAGFPVVPIKQLGEYLECANCLSTFNPRALDFHAEDTAERARIMLSLAIKRVMFKIALADDKIDNIEIIQIANAFRDITKLDIKTKDVAAELEASRFDPHSLSDYLRGVRAYLDDNGKEQIFRAAIWSTSADGNIEFHEMDVLKEIIGALEIRNLYIILFL